MNLCREKTGREDASQHATTKKCLSGTPRARKTAGQQREDPRRLECHFALFRNRPPHGDRKPGIDRSGQQPKDPHYPSWGSETRQTRSLHTGRCCTHYPSWGSETRQTRSLHRVDVVLITPHGDRKLGPGAPHEEERGSRKQRDLPNGQMLITPHGDRKRSKVSLPPWGSGPL